MISRERRWIILCDDGRHVTVGRHTDPTEEELDRAADGLRANGLGGWTAILEGGYYTQDNVSLMKVREIVPARQSWDAASTEFLALRRRAMKPPSPDMS